MTFNNKKKSYFPHFHFGWKRRTYIYLAHNVCIFEKAVSSFMRWDLMP